MRSRISIWQALNTTTWDHWREAILLILFTLVGGLAPLWIGLLIVQSTSGSPQLLDFAAHGEFALYTASLLAPCIYLVVQESAETPFVGRTFFVLLAFFGILLAVASYTMVAPETSKVIPFAPLDRAFIGHGTISLFCISLILSLTITTLENARTYPPIHKIEKSQESELENEFDRL